MGPVLMVMLKYKQSILGFRVSGADALYNTDRLTLLSRVCDLWFKLTENSE